MFMCEVMCDFSPLLKLNWVYLVLLLFSVISIQGVGFSASEQTSVALLSLLCRDTWPPWMPKVYQKTWRERTRLFLGTFTKYLTGIKSKPLLTVFLLHSILSWAQTVWSIVGLWKDKRTIGQMWTNVTKWLLSFCAATSWESWRSVW